MSRFKVGQMVKCIIPESNLKGPMRVVETRARRSRFGAGYMVRVVCSPGDPQYYEHGWWIYERCLAPISRKRWM